MTDTPTTVEFGGYTFGHDRFGLILRSGKSPEGWEGFTAAVRRTVAVEEENVRLRELVSFIDGECSDSRYGKATLTRIENAITRHREWEAER